RASPVMHHVFWISFLAIFIGTALPLAGTVATGAIHFTANEVIPIGGMLANNGLIAINLAYQNLDRAFVQDGTNIESKLSLAATPKLASKGAIRESIRLAIVPTIDSVKTYGLVSIPGMMTGLIIGGVPPLQAIKFQLLVVFIHTTATIMSALIATYLSYGQFFNARHQLVARNTDVKSES
ncbi:TPA: ABC transporter permease, partial [Staphylococcus aureus]